MKNRDAVISQVSFLCTAKRIVRLTKPSSQLVTWYVSFVTICFLVYVSLYFYSSQTSDNVKPLQQHTHVLYAITRPLQLFKKLLQKQTKSKEQAFQELVRDFRIQWYRQRKSRVDWERMIRPCLDNRDWGQVKPGWDKSQRSSASRSVIYYKDIRPAREFSRIFIQSRTSDGQIKSIGGDTWRLYLRGPSSFAATVFDHNNGTYEALFLVMEPGHYRLEAILDYSLCDGYRDPPIDWFIKGNSHGKFQREGILGQLDDYVHETFDEQLSINVTKRRMTTSIESMLSQPSCSKQCNFLMDGYGRWVNNTWIPVLDDSVNASRVASGRGPSGVLLVYGDSVALRFGSSITRNKKTCGELYKSCPYTYNWIYPVGNEQSEKREDDDLDFDGERVISYIRRILEKPDINNNASTLLLNIGLHYVMTINFTTYQHLIDKVIDVILERQHSTLEKSELKHKARVIWKTTSSIKKENALSWNTTEWRFFTTQRILLFNSYSTWAMCRAGIPVLDVHPVTDSYAPGPSDVVHYSDYVFGRAEKALAEFKISELNGKKRVQTDKAKNTEMKKLEY